jgi:hypothetical protein
MKEGRKEERNIYFLSLDTFFTLTHATVKQSFCGFSSLNYATISTHPE